MTRKRSRNRRREEDEEWYDGDADGEDWANRGGPFETLGTLPGTNDGWHELDMHLIQRLLHFAKNNSEIQAVQKVCYTNVARLTGVHIEPVVVGKSSSASDGQRLAPVDSHAAMAMAQRSANFVTWACDGFRREDAIGFAPTVIVRNENRVAAAAGDPLRPSLLVLGRVHVFHRLDVYGRHSWRFFEYGMDTPSPTGGMVGREILGVIVLHDASPPDEFGNLNSIVLRVMTLDWSLYQHKRALTFRADSARAAPRITTQANDGGGGARNDATSGRNVTSAVSPHLNTVPLGELPPCDARAAQTRAVQIRAAHLNHLQNGTALTDAELDALKKSAPPAPAAASASGEIEIRPGRVYVHAQMAEAPADLMPVRLAYLATVCQEFGVPMSMIASGDTTGKSRLNSASATTEMARIFHDGQSYRRSRLEIISRGAWQYMYADAQVEAFIRAEVERDGADATVPLADMVKSTDVLVTVPCELSFEHLDRWLATGVVRYDAYCQQMSSQTGVSTGIFNHVQGMTEDAQHIYGCARPPPPAASQSATKKKKKTKKQKTSE
jgi:hypothetical protein